MSEHWQTEFARDASLLPHLLDTHNDMVLLSRLTEQHYKQASFLDQRIGADGPGRFWVRWQDLADIPLLENPPPHYIFHIGHVGSTLVSRLLGELPTVMAIREPQVLRGIADIRGARGTLRSLWSEADYEKRLEQVLGWYARRFNPEQTSMLKMSSFVSDIAGDIIGPHHKALFIYTSLERYLETILAGEASLREMHQLAPLRIQRLHNRLPAFDTPLWKMSLTQKIAMSWMCEMISLLHTADRDAHNVLWLDFDAFLQTPSSSLQQVARFFSHDLDEKAAHTLISGPIMSTYSKAPEHSYSPDLRRQLLEQARARYTEHIAAATNWAHSLAERFAVARIALEMTRGLEHVQEDQRIERRPDSRAESDRGVGTVR